MIVELPGVEDPDRVKDILKTTALLEFRLVKAGPAPTVEELLEPYEGQVPADMEMMESDPDLMERISVLSRSNVSEVVGNDLRSARAHHR